MEIVNRRHFYSTKVALLPMLFIIALVLPLSSTAKDSARDNTTIHEGRLNPASDRNILEDYSFSEDLVAQATGGELLEETPEVETRFKGAGGYYGDKDWQAFVALYLWFVGMDGRTGRGDMIADVDVSFGDIWDNLDFGIQGHVELWYKKFIFFVDPMYMNLSSSNSNTRVIGTLRSELDIEMFLMDIAAGYRVATVPLGNNTQSNNFKVWPALSVDLYGGGRIIALDTRLDLTIDTPLGSLGRRVKLSETWFDFIVGTRLLFDFTENLLLSVRSDIGGFGLGFSSDIDWNFAANVGYQLPWWGVTPYVGYRVLYIDYRDGSGDNRFVYDVWHTGPQVGIGVRF